MLKLLRHVPVPAVLLAFAAMLPQAASADDKLTNSLAQSALNKWLPDDGKKQVIGVMDFPQESAARADITLTNFVWNSPKNDAVTAYAMGPGGGSHTFNGNATAIFKHYNDGRWILVTVSGPFGNFENLNLEAGSGAGNPLSVGQHIDESSPGGVMTKIDLKRKPARGPANAKVTIVEYGDFQCPFSARAYQTMENQVLKEYDGKVRFIYKNFLIATHPWAESAAIASECALDQKNPTAYWKLYHYFFENQGDLTTDNLKGKSIEALKGTKIDAATFTDCFDNKKTQYIVKKEMAEGSSVGVNGTPFFVINGHGQGGAQPFDVYKTLIDSALADAK